MECKDYFPDDTDAKLNLDIAINNSNFLLNKFNDLLVIYIYIYIGLCEMGIRDFKTTGDEI